VSLIIISKLLGRQLRALRIQRKVNQATLAKRIGVTQPYIVALEKGRENPTLTVLAKLADALRVEIRNLFPKGGHVMAQLTAEERNWNKEVEDIASKLEAVEAWARDLEKWGLKDKDWYSARGAGRLAGLLHQAIAETYDLQVWSDEDEISNWRNAQAIEGR
jgi:transcriptional regulator with XRE-family HTH domain